MIHFLTIEGLFLNGEITLKQEGQGKIINYLQGGNTQVNNQVLIRIEGVTSYKEAAPFLGRKCIWESSSRKKITGKVIKVHGKNGVILVRFTKGIPGQAFGTPVVIK